MGTSREPVMGSGRYPEWIDLVSNPEKSILGRSPTGSLRTAFWQHHPLLSVPDNDLQAHNRTSDRDLALGGDAGHRVTS
eukprot:1950673-Rhodomonas_salina.3